MGHTSPDAFSVADKAQPVERRVPLVVVGGGTTGLSAATAAARSGMEVLLIDENPMDISMMSMDVPLHFGQGMMTSIEDRGTMLQRMVSSNEDLHHAEEAGVDIMLSTYVWGAYRNSENVRELNGPMLGVANDEKSWFIEYDQIVVAAGARDLVMAFEGSEKAGTLGANGAWSLMERYQALAARRIVVIGSGNIGLKTAQMALDRGIQVAGVVEVGPEVRGNSALLNRLKCQGVPFYVSHSVRRAVGRGEDVEGIEIMEVGKDLRPASQSEKLIECDGIVLAIGLVPNVELLDLLGVDLPFQSTMGGFAPRPDEWMGTNVPSVYVAGDGAGFQDYMILNENFARTQGTLAGLAAAESLGAVHADVVRSAHSELENIILPEGSEVYSHYQTWIRSFVAVGGVEVNACQCEEVTRADLLGVKPPRYLRWESDQMAARDLSTLIKDGPVDQDQIKRLTRAGMGYCQGRRCREQVALLLADAGGTDVSRMPMSTYRPPVRPLPLRLMSADDESQKTRDNWTVWFGFDWRETGESGCLERSPEWGKSVR